MFDYHIYGASLQWVFDIVEPLVGCPLNSQCPNGTTLMRPHVRGWYDCENSQPTIDMDHIGKIPMKYIQPLYVTLSLQSLITVKCCVQCLDVGSGFDSEVLWKDLGNPQCSPFTVPSQVI